jgi:hypothetical protein
LGAELFQRSASSKLSGGDKPARSGGEKKARLGGDKPARGKTVVIGERTDFAARLVHALVIAGLLFHMKITELLLKCMYCVDGRLKADMEVICFEGEHGVTFGIAVTLLLLYSFGYPLTTLVVLCRAKRGKKTSAKVPQARRPSLRMGRTISIDDLAQAKLRSSFGVLFDDVRDAFFWWPSVQFAYNWCLAILVAFNPAPDMKLFFIAMLDLSIITFIYVRSPFRERGDNGTAITFGLVAAVQSIVLLVTAMLLTLPIPAINLPEWLAVPPPMAQDTMATAIFAFVPLVWLTSFACAKPALACHRLCKLKYGGKKNVKGLDTDGNQLPQAETLDTKVSGSLASLASSARNRRLGGLAAALKLKSSKTSSPTSVFREANSSLTIKDIQTLESLERSPSGTSRTYKATPSVRASAIIL